MSAGPAELDRAAPGRNGDPHRYTLGEMRELAETLVQSAFVRMNPHQAMILMLLCEAHGLHPIRAMERFDIVDGRPAMKAQAMLAEFQRDGGKVQWVRIGDDGCWAVFEHPVHCPGGIEVSFTVDDARRAGLISKDAYRRYPSDMFRARTISRGIRMVDPGILMGLYTPEEMMDSLAARERPAIEPPARPRSREEAPAPATTATAPEAPAISEFRQFIRDTIAAESAVYRAELSRLGLLRPDEPAFVENEHQVIYGLVRDWIIEGAITRESVCGEGGKKDPRKVAAVARSFYDDDPDGVRHEVRLYVEKKKHDALHARGLDSIGDADESQAVADEDPMPAKKQGDG